MNVTKIISFVKKYWIPFALFLSFLIGFLCGSSTGGNRRYKALSDQIGKGFEQQGKDLETVNSIAQELNRGLGRIEEGVGGIESTTADLGESIKRVEETSGSLHSGLIEAYRVSSELSEGWEGTSETMEELQQRVSALGKESAEAD